MIIKYVVYVDNNEYCTVSSRSEADTVVGCLQMQNPQQEFKIEEIQVSMVKSGFGRDPDLH